MAEPSDWQDVEDWQDVSGEPGLDWVQQRDHSSARRQTAKRSPHDLSMVVFKPWTAWRVVRHTCIRRNKCVGPEVETDDKRHGVAQGECKARAPARRWTLVRYMYSTRTTRFGLNRAGIVGGPIR